MKGEEIRSANPTDNVCRKVAFSRLNSSSFFILSNIKFVVCLVLLMKMFGIREGRKRHEDSGEEKRRQARIFWKSLNFDRDHIFFLFSSKFYNF